MSAVRAAIAVTLADGNLLMVRRAKAPDRGLWGFPGGRVEQGETATEAAVRECREETGIGVVAIRELGEIEVRKEGFHYRMTAVLCEGHAEEPVAADDAEAARWVALEEALAGGADFSENVARLARRAVRAAEEGEGR